jgi:hypothetical protein
MATILSARQPRAAFPIRVETALAATLDMLEERRVLAQLLTAEAGDDRELAARRASWAQTFGALLREAAESQPDLQLPPALLEPQLIAGAGETIGASLRDPAQSDLRTLLPYLLEYLLSYYVGREELAGILATCAAGGAVRAGRHQ